MRIALLLVVACHSPTVSVCQGTSSQCGDSCVNLVSDQQNCGACGAACGANQVCTAGSCVMVAACLPGSIECGGTCVRTDSDQNNCGACGTACTAAQRCVAGSCVTPMSGGCPTPLAQCGDLCVDTGQDARHCGGCDEQCAYGVACVSGACRPTPWEVVAENNDVGGFVERAPSGGQIYFLAGSQLFSLTGDVFTARASITETTYLAGLARIGGKLYSYADNSLLEYAINADAWTPIIQQAFPPQSFQNSQTASDSSGFVYAVDTSNRRLARYDTSVAGTGITSLVAATGLTFVTLPTGYQDNLGQQRPRLAWDSSVQRLFIGNTETTSIVAYNPNNGTFAPIAPFPFAQGIGGAFCDDGKGHLFTGASDAPPPVLSPYVYSYASNTWQPLPAFPLGTNRSACVVTDDGYAYYANFSEEVVGRLALPE